MADEKLIAPKHRRLAAFIADAILVFLLWYLMTMKDLGRVDTLLESLDPLTEGALDRLAESIFKMATAVAGLMEGEITVNSTIAISK